MAKINLNTLAKELVESEGGKENLSIAQVKEVLKLAVARLGEEWKNGNEVGVIELLKKE